MEELIWVEISRSALAHNMQEFRRIIGPDKILCPCVKSNAYGHGIAGAAFAFLEAGADFLSVNSLKEARILREAGIVSPIYILGYVGLESLEQAASLDCRLVVYNRETVEKLGRIGKPVRVHLKAETGNNRQGLAKTELVELARYILQFPNIEIEGVATHFANIEDTTDHSYAEKQLAIFNDCVRAVEDLGIKIKIRHCANSAATILFPETHFEMVRPGIASYGMWPSSETFLSYKGENLNLVPALTWKTRIAQIKKVAEGEFIGYGCTFRATRETRLAILPVGYYDGYDRCLSGAHVLIRGRRAPVRGRICMNIIMVDVTDIPEARLEDEVVLMGCDGNEMISAEQFGKWAGTINYEVTTRINDNILRIYI